MKNHCSHGATMASLNQDILGRIELPEVGRDEQRRIASILSAYDDLIENNTRRIQILEAMAQAIYREWFVEFRFPDTRACGWWIRRLGRFRRVASSPLSEVCARMQSGARRAGMSCSGGMRATSTGTPQTSFEMASSYAL
jgi:type I restriction enzyme S subunit